MLLRVVSKRREYQKGKRIRYQMEQHIADECPQAKKLVQKGSQEIAEELVPDIVPKEKKLMEPPSDSEEDYEEEEFLGHS